MLKILSSKLILFGKIISDQRIIFIKKCLIYRKEIETRFLTFLFIRFERFGFFLLFFLFLSQCTYCKIEEEKKLFFEISVGNFLKRETPSTILDWILEILEEILTLKDTKNLGILFCCLVRCGCWVREDYCALEVCCW